MRTISIKNNEEAKILQESIYDETFLVEVSDELTLQVTLKLTYDSLMAMIENSGLKLANLGKLTQQQAATLALELIKELKACYADTKEDVDMQLSTRLAIYNMISADVVTALGEFHENITPSNREQRRAKDKKSKASTKQRPTII